MTVAEPKHAVDTYVGEMLTRLQREASADQGIDKERVRSRLLKRKRELLLEHRDELRTHEAVVQRQLHKIDYARIKPVLVYTTKAQYPLWVYYRMLVSSAPYTGRPGRAIRVWCIDQVSGSPLGVLEVGSDLQNVHPRDEWIGWSRAQKYQFGGLQRCANVSTCVAVQPFGTLCGGKYMLDALVTTDAQSMYQVWMQKYHDRLALLTITSLFGKSSIYNRLPTVEYLGTTVGRGVAQISNRDYEMLKAFALSRARTGRTVNRTFLTLSRNDLLDVACKELGVKRDSLSAPSPKGIYLASLVENPVAVLKDNAAAQPISRTAQDAQQYYHDRWYTMRKANPEIYAQVQNFDPQVYRVDAMIDACDGQR